MLTWRGPETRKKYLQGVTLIKYPSPQQQDLFKPAQLFCEEELDAQILTAFLSASNSLIYGVFSLSLIHNSTYRLSRTRRRLTG